MTKRINRRVFFDRVRQTVFSGYLTQKQVDNLNVLLDTLEEYKITDLPVSFGGYILGTVRGEVGPDMAPVREGFAQSDAEAILYVEKLYQRGRISRNYGKRLANGRAYYGRGYVQLTHKANYERLGNYLDIDLVDNPDLALDPQIAARVLVVGMLNGLFTGWKLSDFLPENPTLARRIINGDDRAHQFAAFAAHFEEALEAAIKEGVAPLPTLVDTPRWLSYILNWLKRLFGGNK